MMNYLETSMYRKRLASFDMILIAIRFVDMVYYGIERWDVK